MTKSPGTTHSHRRFVLPVLNANGFSESVSRGHSRQALHHGTYPWSGVCSRIRLLLQFCLSIRAPMDVEPNSASSCGRMIPQQPRSTTSMRRLFSVDIAAQTVMAKGACDFVGVYLRPPNPEVSASTVLLHHRCSPAIVDRGPLS